MNHFPFHEIARELAENWGREASSIKEAAGVVGMQEAAGMACLELVLRLNQVIDALSEGREKKEGCLEKPFEGAGVFDVKVGDSLWSCFGELEGGVARVLVVGCDDEGHALVVPTHKGNPPVGEWNSPPCWANDGYRKTPEEALEHQAREDLAYHNEEIALVKEAMKALESGNISSFME